MPKQEPPRRSGWPLPALGDVAAAALGRILPAMGVFFKTGVGRGVVFPFTLPGFSAADSVQDLYYDSEREIDYLDIKFHVDLWVWGIFFNGWLYLAFVR